MIDENALSHKRGDLVEFELSLGGGAKRCTALVLNTGVLMGRAARQVWIVDIKDPMPRQETAWLHKKHLVHESQISCLVPAVFIGRETLLRDNPVTFDPIPLKDGNHAREKEA